MKIHSETAVLERGGVEGEQTFRIQANARAFSILSSNLYRNKIRAVIRELCCNALDSHIAAGKAHTPFVVHLPNALEPYLEISDQGVGLTHEQVMNIYTTYFASTKNNTNDLIGGLGLGGKSPFAYTNSFTVSATHDGVCRNYAMVINEVGEPAVVPMGTTVTNAANGVSVRIPVKTTDLDKFRAEAESVLRWFDQQPTVVGNANFKLPEVPRLPVFEGDRWYMVKRDYYDRNVSGAVMGNVFYPIQSENMHKRFYELLAHNAVIVRFDIGELDIQPSREELSYDPVTVQVLEARLDQVLNNMSQLLSAHFDTCTTLWQARCAMRKLESNSDTSNVLSMIVKGGQTIKWNNQDVTNTRWLDWGSSKMFDDKNPAPHVWRVDETYRAREVHHVDALAHTVFVVADCADAGVRCRLAYYEQANANPTYLIRGDQAQIDRLINWLGNPEVILASSLPKGERKSMPFKGRAWSGGYRSWGRASKGDNWHTEQKLNTSQGGYYVTVLHNDPVDAADNVMDLKGMIQAARNLGLITGTDKIWGINKTNTRLVNNLKNWINFPVWLREQVSLKVHSMNMAQLITTRRRILELENELHGGSDLWQRHFGQHTNAVGKLVRDWLTAKNALGNTKVDDLKQAAAVLGIQVCATTNQPIVNLCWTEVEQRYPLLKHARSVHEDALMAEFVDYVNLVDSK